MKVLITGNLPVAAEKILKKNKITVISNKNDSGLTRAQLIRNVKDVDGVISLLSDKIDKEVIDKMNKCKIIANYAVGFNNIDVSYAKKNKIIVTNTPDVLTDATADIAFGLALSASRRFHEGEKMMRSGKFKGWRPQLLLGYEFRGKTFGIIGAGRIGQAVGKRAVPFGAKVVYYNKSKKKDFEKETGAKKVSLKSLLSKSDIISVHLPLNDKTFKLLNQENMKLIKNSAVLINTARGEIVDEKLLIDMLKKGKIFAAGFDVYEGEPQVNKELLKLDNVVLLPHLGSASYEARNKMAEIAAFNTVRVLKGKAPVTPV